MGAPAEKMGAASVHSPDEERFIVALKDGKGSFSRFVEFFTLEKKKYTLSHTTNLFAAKRFNQVNAHAIAKRISITGTTTRVEWVSDDRMVREVS
jgi:hypothetical protein